MDTYWFITYQAKRDGEIFTVNDVIKISPIRYILELDLSDVDYDKKREAITIDTTWLV